VDRVLSEARSGGGAAAESDWPSAALRLRCEGLAAPRLARLLRDARPALLGTVRQEDFFLDLAAITREELSDAAQVLRRILSRAAKQGGQ